MLLKDYTFIIIWRKTVVWGEWGGRKGMKEGISIHQNCTMEIERREERKKEISRKRTSQVHLWDLKGSP